MRSVHKALTRGGVFLVMVPHAEGVETFEDASITDPHERAAYFGAYDHIRYFGSNLVQRLERADFSVERYTPQEPIVGRYGLWRGETLFITRAN